MAQTIKLKRGTTTPTTSNIVSGEVAVDTSAQKLYINDAGTIKAIGGISNVVEDTSPELGGSLGTNGNSINFPDSSAGSNTLTFGNSSDMQIFHDGSNRIRAESRLVIDTQDLDIYSSTGGTGVETMITADVNGTVKLYYDGDAKVETTNTGAEITGRLDTTTLRVGTMNYPSSDGTNGQVLTTNGAGTLSFTTPSGLSNVVEDTTPELGGHLAGGGFTITDVKYAEFNDYIEINTATDGEAIRINDSTGPKIKWYDNAGTTSYGYIRGTSTGVDIQSESDIELNIGLSNIAKATSTAFSIHSSADFSVQSDALFVDGSSKDVGIGTTGPNSKLEVEGVITTAGLNTSAEINVENTNGAINFKSADGTTTYGNYQGDAGGLTIQATSQVVDVRANGALSARFGNSNSSFYGTCTFDNGTFRVDSFNNRVGVGTLSPATELDVDGVITATGGTSTNWNTAYGWGDHSTAGYLTGITGQSIENLSDVNAMTPTDGQVLTWDNANSRWDAADASGGGLTQAKATAISLVFG